MSNTNEGVPIISCKCANNLPIHSDIKQTTRNQSKSDNPTSTEFEMAYLKETAPTTELKFKWIS